MPKFVVLLKSGTHFQRDRLYVRMFLNKWICDDFCNGNETCTNRHLLRNKLSILMLYKKGVEWLSHISEINRIHIEIITKTTTATGPIVNDDDWNWRKVCESFVSKWQSDTYLEWLLWIPVSLKFVFERFFELFTKNVDTTPW